MGIPRRRARHRRLAVLTAVVSIAALVWVLSSGGSPRPHHPARVAAAPTVQPKPRPRPAIRHHPQPSPGRLPQTSQFPRSDTPRFRARMAALWRGMATGSVQAAMPAFFPEAAYAQVKAIASPAADWQSRLVGGYRLDIAAAHSLVGSGQLVRVDVPSQFGHWVPPGTCYNGVGYYEVPNARVVYRRGGELRSLGIASMISWRGEWYVVHLGAVGQSGVVDDPELGPGASAPSSTC